MSAPAGGRGAHETTTQDLRACALTASLALLYVLLRLWRASDSCLWFDEIFGVHAAARVEGWGAMWRLLAADLVHPPLFYVLLKIWIALGGEALAWLRLLPVLASALALVPLLLLCRELRLGAAERNFALLLCALSGYLIKYAQEVRMYAVVLPLALCSLWLFARFARAEGRRSTVRALAPLALANLLLVYTHYFGWLVVVTQLLFLYASRERRRALPLFAAASLAVAASFLPWAYAASGAAASQGEAGLAQNIGWMSRPGPADFVRAYVTFGDLLRYRQSGGEAAVSRPGAILSALVFGLPLLLLLWRSRRRDNRSDGVDSTGHEAVAFLLWFAAVPTVLAFALSYLLPHSVWGERHLMIAAAPYLLLCGVALARLRPRWLKASALVLLGCWVVIAAAPVLLRPKPFYVWCAWETLARRAAEDELRAGGDAAAGPGQGVRLYAFEEAVAYHLWFALSAEDAGRFRIAAVKNLPGVAEDPAYFLPRGFDGVSKLDAREVLNDERFWVAFRDSAWRTDKQPLKLLFERGYKVSAGYQQEAAGGVTAYLVPVSRE